MSAEVLKRHVELLVLSALNKGPGHGYALIGTIRARSRGEFELLEGSIYPLLHRLERRGQVTSKWSQVAGRKRRVYTLTRKGKAVLAEQEHDWRRFQQATNLVLSRA